MKALDVSFQRIRPFALCFTNETVKSESIVPPGVLFRSVFAFENLLALIARKHTFLLDLTFLFPCGLNFTLGHCCVSVVLNCMLLQKALSRKSFIAKFTVISDPIMYET